MARKSSARGGWIGGVFRGFGRGFTRLRGVAILGATRLVIVNLAVALLVLGVAGGAFFAQGWMKRRVADIRREPLRLSINWPTVSGDSTRTWLPESARREVTSVVMTRLNTDVFDRASLDAARDALLRTGWFTAVTDVRREAGGEIVVRATWRTPAAVVRWQEKDHLVAGGGELLPLIYEKGGAGPGVRVIEGAEFGPPTLPGTVSGALAGANLAFGEAWSGGEVQSALTLLAGLKRAFGETSVWAQIAGVDARRVRTDGALAIITDTGSRVVWGSPPGKVVPGEQTVDQKLARLARLAKGPQGRIDAGERQVEIHGAHVFVEHIPEQGLPASAAAADERR